MLFHHTLISAKVDKAHLVKHHVCLLLLGLRRLVFIMQPGDQFCRLNDLLFFTNTWLFVILVWLLFGLLYHRLDCLCMLDHLYLELNLWTEMFAILALLKLELCCQVTWLLWCLYRYLDLALMSGLGEHWSNFANHNPKFLVTARDLDQTWPDFTSRVLHLP